MKKLLVALGAVASLGITGAANAADANVTFSEVVLAHGTLLDGTAHYASYGLSFLNTTYVVAGDGRFADEHGINSAAPDKYLTVKIAGGNAVDVTFDWVAYNGSTDIFATAYNAANEVIGSWSESGLDGGLNQGTATLFAANNTGVIDHITWNDGPNAVGIDRLQVSVVPEPEIYAMIGIGMGLMGFVARRRKLKEAA